MTTLLITETVFHGRLKTAARGLFWLGLVLAALGVAAIAFPVAATLVATLYVGWMLLLAGIIGFIGSFSINGTGPFFGQLLVALLSVAVGVFLVFNPLAGEIALTLVVGALFMVQGAFEIFFAFEIRPLRGWGGMLLSGIASAAVAILIASAWPGASVIFLGILLGVNFISTGVAYVWMSRALSS